MKIVIVALLVALALADGTCHTFKCGSVKNTSDKDDQLSCYTPPADGTDGIIQACKNKTQQCEKAFAEANSAPGSGDFVDSQICMPKTNSTPEALTNQVVGDYCNVTSNCLKTLKCTAEGACAAEGDECKGEGGKPETGLCAAGKYCDSDNKCKAYMTKDDKCTTNEQCGMFNVCLISTGGEGDGKCVAVNSQKPGTPVTSTCVEACASFSHATINDGIYCTKPSISDVDSFEKAQEKQGSFCNYTYYENKDDFETPTANSTLSKCGFNKDANSYCAQHKGDPIYQAMITQAKTLIANTDAPNCNPKSNSKGSYKNGNSTNGCVAFEKSAADDLKKMPLLATQANWATAGDNAWPLVADNSDCIKETITAKYFGKLGAAQSMIATVAVATATALYMM